MRKRISKDKDFKSSIEKKMIKTSLNPVKKCLPLQTLQVLISKTEGLKTIQKFEKQRIDGIVRGGNISSVKFQQIQKNICFQSYIRKYYCLQNTRYIFTDLIKRNSSQELTFIDFKLRHYKIMNTYAKKLKIVKCTKGKEERTLTASHSSTNEDRCFKEMEMEVKKLTKNRANSHKKAFSSNASTSFIQLVSNIQKMIRNIKDPGNFNVKQPVLDRYQTLQKISTPDISNIHQSRIHTSPEPLASDSYGLGDFKEKNKVKLQGSHAKRIDLCRLKKQSSKQTLRYQTEYDTEYIVEAKSKVKKQNNSGKKLFSKNKGLSKGKSPPMSSRSTLKLKK